MDHQEESEAYVALGAKGSSSIQRALKRGINEADRLASSQRGPNAGDSTPSTVQEVVHCKQARNSKTTGDRAPTSEAPNLEPGANFMSWSGIERGRHVEHHSSLNSESVAPATGSATIQEHTEEAATTGGYTTSEMAQIPSGPPSNYKGWLLDQLNQLESPRADECEPASGALMARNSATFVAAGNSGFLPPWATPNSSASKEAKPTLAASEEDVAPDELKKFQTQLLNAIDGQNLPLAESVVEKIRKAVPEKSLKVSAFILAVNFCINVLSKSERVEEGPGLKTFLVLLDNAVVSMRVPALAPLRVAIQKLFKASPEEKLIDTETLYIAIQAMRILIF